MATPKASTGPVGTGVAAHLRAAQEQQHERGGREAQGDHARRARPRHDQTARAAPNCTEIPAEITSATGPSPEPEPEPEPGPESFAGDGAGAATAGEAAGEDEEEGAGISPD
ncbi:hypothetical protein Snoj_83340 [Streptomyces nojiriensis]|uniref:Uncharacterized protein n=1 Tax=Streptomyces nojiriensis TaxID=66374 RepID=A0ABQ3T202_9ACTN|nr:hypothetical protein Snoj_83340 [Streptomyces nojiriensis]